MSTASRYRCNYGIWLYNQLLATASQISFKEATERAAHSTARNAVLILISQGTEVTIVTEYVICHPNYLILFHVGE